MREGVDVVKFKVRHAILWEGKSPEVSDWDVVEAACNHNAIVATSEKYGLRDLWNHPSVAGGPKIYILMVDEDKSEQLYYFWWGYYEKRTDAEILEIIKGGTKNEK